MLRLVLAVAYATCVFSSAAQASELTSSGKLLNQGDVQRAERHWAQAEEAYKKALTEARRTQDAHQEMKSLSRLGMLYQREGRYSASERMYRADLELAQRRSDVSEYEVATAQSSLAGVLHAARKYREAEKLFLQVAMTCERLLGVKDQETASAWNNLAAVYFEQGRMEEAEEYYRRAWEQEGTAAGGLSALMIGNNLALLYAETKRPRQAESLYREIVARLRFVVGGEHEAIATTLNNLGLLCYRQGRKEEALQYLAESSEINDRRLGPTHPTSLETARNYAFMLRQTKHKKEAEAYEARVRESRLDAPPKTVDVTSLLRQRSE